MSKADVAGQPAKPTARRALRALAIEHSALLVPATLFLITSAVVHNQGWSAVAPHLIIVFSFAAGFSAIRLLLSERLSYVWVPAHGLAMACLIGFYLLAVTGYSYWGRLPTLPMILPYVRNLADLLTALQITPARAIVAFVVYVGLCIIFSAMIYRWSADWLRVSRRQSAAMRCVAVFAGIALSALAVINLSTERYVNKGEPLTLSLHASVPASGLNNTHRVTRSVEDNNALASRAEYVAADPQLARNIILIIGDALRPDRMSLFGASRNTTPELSKLVESETLAYSGVITTSCAESFCGLVSMARSRYVHQLSRHDLTLNEILAMHGYQQRLVLGGDHTNFYGLRDWFGEVDHYWDGTMADGYVNDDLAVVQQIANLPQWNGIPEYLQIHLMSTHALGAREAEFERWTPTHNYYGNPAFSGTADELNNKVINYYDNGMLQFDRNVARVIEALEPRGYLSDALVVITGDHGEMLGEHQLYSHGNGVFQPVIEVPLIMLRFGHSGPAYNTQAGTAQIDIAPTIASELGVPVPNRWQGLTLDKVQDRKFAFFTHKEEFGLLDYTQPDKQWKYWLHRKSGLEYAYELTSDPSESDNRIVSIPPAQRAAWREVLYPSLVSLPLH